MSDSPTKFSVILPCYNEVDAIGDAIIGLRSLLEDCEYYELIVVDDGSSDGSREFVEKMAAADPALKVIQHDHNRGYGAALKSGIRRAAGDLIVITDADGTYPNDRIPDLLKLAEGADMVVGARTGKVVEYSALRKVPKLFLGWYSSWIAGQKIPDINSGLRVFRKSIAEKFLNILPNSFSFTTTITLAMLTNDYVVRYEPIDYLGRIGKSKINPVTDTLRFIQLIIRTGIYFAPLRALAPIIVALTAGFLASLGYDVFIRRDITDQTMILLTILVNMGIFALLADMIDKRSGR